MTSGMTKEQVLGVIREEIAAKRAEAERASSPVEREFLLEQAGIREEVAEEEAEAIAAEIAENQRTAALSLRVPASLAAALKARAEVERIPTSELVRRLLTEALQAPSRPVLTAGQVEEIARRVYQEERRARENQPAQENPEPGEYRESA